MNAATVLHTVFKCVADVPCYRIIMGLERQHNLHSSNVIFCADVHFHIDHGLTLLNPMAADLFK